MFTVDPVQEARAGTVSRGLHRVIGRRSSSYRFESGFIKPELVSFDELVAAGSEFRFTV